LILLIIGGVQLRIRGIRATNKELEKRVKERTKELLEAQEKLNLANNELKAQLTEITELEQKMHELAIHDALTGLYNRHYLSERLDAEISHALRKNYPIAFLLMDLDHFKSINDTYGHQAGDLTLIAAAHAIRTHIRQSDIVCRYGGEEFMIIMPEIGMEDALQRAEYFRKCIDELRIEHESRSIHITASVGIAVYPIQGTDGDKILSMADTAMYQAKQAGRNNVIVYSAEH